MKVITRTPAGSVALVENIERSGGWVRCAMHSHDGKRIMDAQLSENAAHALFAALSQFCSDRGGEFTIERDEDPQRRIRDIWEDDLG